MMGLIFLQNKILSTCLQEEKERYKKLEDSFRDNRIETQTLVVRVAHIRQLVIRIYMFYLSTSRKIANIMRFGRDKFWI